MAEVPKNWNIRKKDLENLSYDALKWIFYGTHNIKIPFKMLNKSNPDEIISKLWGGGRIKKADTISIIAKYNFMKLCAIIDKYAYPQIGNMAKQCKKIFSSKPRDQQKRLESLDASVQRVFVHSFSEQYKYPIHMKPEDPNSFYDPNCDGKSKKVYVDRIYEYLQELYEKSLLKAY